MKAVVFYKPGSPDVLIYRTQPELTLQENRDVKVQLHAVGVNPIDTKLRSRGTFFPENMPAILGLDGAGTVVEVAPQVSKFKLGDPVYFCQGGLGDQPGTYADYAVVNEAYLAPKPQYLDFPEAAAAPLVLITAWEALYDRAQLQAGQTLLIQAGAGGVGHVAIQLAKQRGAKVCTTISSLEKAAFVQSLGADLAIDYTRQDVVQAVLDWTDGQGVDVAFDTIGESSLSQCFAATKHYGTVVTLLAPEAVTDWKIARNRNLRVGFELMLTPLLQNVEAAKLHQVEILERCATLFNQGKLKVHVTHRFPLREAATAHRTLEQGSMKGKIVLIPE